MNVRWVPKNFIARSASDLLVGYEQLVGHAVHPPIPVEHIIERYLGVSLSFEDLEARLGMEDVLGATFIKSKAICINEKLLDDRSEGRMMFTCAHEAGHWVLHRHMVEQARRSSADAEAIVCRTRNSRLPIEWQADYFASCLLMPEKEVAGAFSQVWDGNEMVLDNVRSRLGGTSVCVDPCVKNWPFIADTVRQAGGFSNVSKEAMIIRLKELGLVRNKTSAHVGWQRTA
jgi:Zn-dependent peptidase ImmA (M78 family)